MSDPNCPTSVISFAGDTNDAYPLMLQAYNSILMHPPAQSRAIDLDHLKGHLNRVFDHSRSFISNLPHGQVAPDQPGAKFALSGYSWKSKEFRVWTLHYDQSIGRFTFKPASTWAAQDENSYKLICYIGDAEPVAAAQKRLVSVLRDRGKLSSGSLDMEPFEVLRDIIRSGEFGSVGGAIQLVKIYEHSNAVPVGVYWPDRAAGSISVLGRPLMEYETTGWGVIDPDQPDRARPTESVYSAENP